jgi:hypothetical protein
VAEPETTAVGRLIEHCDEVVRMFAAALEGSTAKGRRDAATIRELAEIRQRLLAPLRLANLRSDVAAECETWPNRDRVAKVSDQAIEALGRLASDDIRVYPVERGPDGTTELRVTVDEYVSTREDWLEEKHGFLLPAIESLRGLARPPIAAPDARHSADFTYVYWFDREYKFALGLQAGAVRELWAEWKETGLGLHQETIRERIDAERGNFRMAHVFRNHEALNTMIVKDGDGRYRLAKP